MNRIYQHALFQHAVEPKRERNRICWRNYESLRMAFVTNSDLSVGVFFRIAPNREHVELLWSTVKNSSLLNAA